MSFRLARADNVPRAHPVTHSVGRTERQTLSVQRTPRQNARSHGPGRWEPEYYRLVRIPAVLRRVRRFGLSPRLFCNDLCQSSGRARHQK